MKLVRKIGVLTAGIALAALAGCTDYYRVKDPATGATYFSTGWSAQHDSTVTFRDCITGQPVTMSNPQVTKLSRDEWVAERGAALPPTTKMSPR